MDSTNKPMENCIRSTLDTIKETDLDTDLSLLLDAYMQADSDSLEADMFHNRAIIHQYREALIIFKREDWICS